MTFLRLMAGNRNNATVSSDMAGVVRSYCVAGMALTPDTCLQSAGYAETATVSTPYRHKIG